MRFIIATAALVATASAGYIAYPPAVNTTLVPSETAKPPVYVTTTVSEYETYCPGPTEITTNDKTYTVTEATTLTITDCPCTVTYPVEPTSDVVYPPETYVPHIPSASPIPYPSANGTVVPPPYPTGGAPTPSKSAPPEFEGAAAQYGVAGLAIAGAIVAFL